MIFQKVKEMIAKQLNVAPDKIALESDFMNDLKADSLDVVDLIISFEEEFGLMIDDDAVVNIKTVGDVVSYIESHQ